jgi:hypothetical protein
MTDDHDHNDSSGYIHNNTIDHDHDKDSTDNKTTYII